MPTGRADYPIEPMDFANIRANGVRSLASRYGPNPCRGLRPRVGLCESKRRAIFDGGLRDNGREIIGKYNIAAAKGGERDYGQWPMARFFSWSHQI